MSRLLEDKNGVENFRHISPLLRVALLAGVLVHLAGFFFFRVVSSPLPSPEETPAFIAFVSTNTGSDEAELIEQASLFDSAPLFIPGEWSTASGVFSSGAAQDWQVFPDFEPDIELLSEVRPERLSLPQVADVTQPSDLLALRFWDLFSYFGQKGTEFEKPDARNSVAVVTILSGNKDYPEGYSTTLKTELQPGQMGLRQLTFYMNMSAPGIAMGAPVLEQSSGSEALDKEVLEWLMRPATLANLPAGFLELRIFP